ncbi:hypothetical protein VTO73DRAFT_11898 [Trametes versicolor]
MAEVDRTLPSKKYDDLIAALPRRHANLLVQLRTNHIPLQAYLARIGKTDSATCPTCAGHPRQSNTSCSPVPRTRCTAPCTSPPSASPVETSPHFSTQKPPSDPFSASSTPLVDSALPWAPWWARAPATPTATATTTTEPPSPLRTSHPPSLVFSFSFSMLLRFRAVRFVCRWARWEHNLRVGPREFRRRCGVCPVSVPLPWQEAYSPAASMLLQSTGRFRSRCPAIVWPARCDQRVAPRFFVVFVHALFHCFCVPDSYSHTTNNIVFGAPYDEARYNKVLEQCALKRDLTLFDAGDVTEVGEKGITLSGGQRARITLARAVYSSAEILLLDDILAALDVHTSKWIVDKCLKGELLQGRTIILVTHNVAMVSPVADFVVDMGSNGGILSQGSLASALERDSKLLTEVKEERAEIEKAEQEIAPEKVEDAEAKPTVGKLVVAEEMEDGHVGWSALKLYIGNMSKRPVLFWLIYMSGNITKHMIGTSQTWYLGHWASQYETHPAGEVRVGHYLTVYTLLNASWMAAAAFCVSYYVFGSIRSARIVHQRLVTSVLGTTLRWLDKTPTARIVARCTEDIQTLDNRIARATELLLELVVYMLLKMFAVVVFSPIFIVPAIMVAVVGGACGNLFMKAQLSVKRELSNSKAPVLSHFGAAIGGITSIRAYGAQEAFKQISFTVFDRCTRVSVTHQNLDRWVSARIDLAGTFFATGLAIYLTYISKMSAANTGFSLNQAMAFSAIIFSVIRSYNDFEIASNSLERIEQYLRIEQEPKNTPEGVPPAYWPASGHLSVEKLSARYSEDGPRVLHDISFEVTSGERIGIVGRTGSGKSSLTLSLLRCILTEGDVRYDGLLSAKVNLDALRSSITIIPQVPELLSGTLRQNLDPFSEHDDAVLIAALRSAGLTNLQNEEDHSRITLDTEIAGGGANLSVGQRQILALARAIVRRSKLLILDEATSAIGYETDSIIQASLRTELGKDVTLLTVAHRLQTIMDADKIMVLDAGRIVEFGKPSELLQNEKGLLRALVDESGDKEKLYAMATGASSS